MPYLVCIEESEGRWIAHVPDLPGCFAVHENRDEAVKAVPQIVEEYVAWCRDHGLRISALSGPMIVAEVIRSWEFEDGQEVSAFFASDRPPIADDELAEFKILLNATIVDLLKTVEGLDVEDLEKHLPGEKRTVGEILRHVANADRWYLDRVGLAFPKEELPADPYAALSKSHDHMVASLPTMVKRSGVVAVAGEAWSARKVMRRTLWHRRDHTQHIERLRSEYLEPR